MLISKEKAAARFRQLTGQTIAESKKAVAAMPSVHAGKRRKVDDTSVIDKAIRLLAEAKSMEPKDRGHGILSDRMRSRLERTTI